MEVVPQDISDSELIILARAALKRAHCPYSKFPVGAAILTEDGTTILGSNIENASYGGTICAERSAICSAVSQGYTKFRAIAVVTELSEPAAPCGLCRQVLVEFGDYKVLIGTASNNKQLITSTLELLPNAFTPESLDLYEKEKGGNEMSTSMSAEQNESSSAET